MQQLKDGDTFPALQAQSVNHGLVTLPADIPEGNYGVVLVYRAHW